jgi:hypothetical protein
MLSAFLSTQVIDTTSVGRSVMTAADAAAARSAIGLGTLATQNGTFSGTSSGTNTGDQDLSGYLLSATAASTYVSLGGTYSNPSWITGLAWSKISGITGTPDGTKFLRDDGSWQTVSGGGGGITSLNSLTGSTQTFAVGTSGTDFAIVSSGTAHTFNIPDASSSNRGLVTTGTQTIAGDKTFSGVLIGDGNIFSNNSGGTATIGIRNGSAGSNRIQMLYGTGFMLSSAYAVTWSPNSTNTNSPDLILLRDAANTLGQRNSTNAQTFNLYGTYTSATSFERLCVKHTTTQVEIGQQKGSAGGSDKPIVIGHYGSGSTITAAITIATDDVVKIGPLSHILAEVTITDAAVTMVANRRYVGSIAAFTADRNYTLPAGTAGDVIEVQITTGDDTYELILLGASGVSINGGSAATEWSRLFINNEFVRFRCHATNDWRVEIDGRRPAEIITVPISQNVPDVTWTTITHQTTTISNGVDVSSGIYTFRRAGRYRINAQATLNGSGTFVNCLVLKNGVIGTGTIVCQSAFGAASGSYYHASLPNSIGEFDLVASDNLRVQVYHISGGSRANESGKIEIKEVFL